jgi:putative restriction endonuclease
METNDRKYWLWVTRPEYYLDDDGRDRADLDPNSGFDSDGWWTCHKETKNGDLVFLWRAKLKRDIGYLIQAESAAYRSPDDDKDSVKGWKYRCNYRVLYKFENPITAKDLRGNSYFNDWSPLKINFQGSFFLIQERYWNKLNQIAIKKNPDYSEIINPISSVSINATADFTASDYVSAFHKLQIAPHHLQMLRANYYAPNRTLTATMMANAMGYDHFSAANLHYGILGGLVGAKLGWDPLPQYKVNVLVDFKESDGSDKDLEWMMKPSVAQAIELLRWTDEQPTIPEEVAETEPIYEGAMRKVSVNAYERSNIAREACLLHYGCVCTACGINLSDLYGEIAQGRIHVHHIKPLSEINSEYQIDPIADLRPVCPNCHYIIHLKASPYSIEEIRKLIKSQQEHLTMTGSKPPIAR